MTLLKPNLRYKTPKAEKESWEKIKRLHLYSDGHGKHLSDKLRKIFPVEVDVFVNVNPGASSSYIVESAIKGCESLTKSNVVVLIAGLDDVTIGKDCDQICNEYLKNIKVFVEMLASTFVLVCPILPQYDLPKNGSVNKTIAKINTQLRINLADSDHATVLNVFPLRRKYFDKYGLHLTSKGKGLLASIIRSAVSRITLRINEPLNVTGNQNNKPGKTLEHVNRFGRKLQRRLTRRTLAEAKALRQQGADAVRCFVYLVDLLARDPQLFTEKAREMWKELSKDEPENQMPPANLEQLIAMLTREMARRVVHLTNYTGAKVVVLSQYGLHAAHITALNAVWWADHLIKTMHLDAAMDAAATQVTRIHYVSIKLLERLVEIIRNLKMESLKLTKDEASILAPNQVLALPAPPQSTPHPHPPRTSSTSSSASTASYSSSSSSAATPTNKVTSSQNGDTRTTTEIKHEAVVD